MREYEIIIIGGGPAGLSAAIGAINEGAKDILVIERDDRLGGILNQCIHNGFGLHRFKEELTGPEYAQRYIDMAEELNLNYKLNTMVLDITKDKTVTYINKEEGIVTVKAKGIILAMGCRERPRGAINIPGTRPAGVYTAGTAQSLVNLQGYMPGKEVVILGSGDIGLIMARRMTFEGAKVKAVVELMPYSGGLKRNIVQCLDDFGIPLLLSHTITEIKGKERIEEVTVAKVDENRNIVEGTEKTFKCDTMLLSVGLLPENELSQKAEISINPITSGPFVNNRLQTNVDGIFACGNVLHVHDLVDFVSEEGEKAGVNCAKYVLGTNVKEGDDTVKITCNNGVRYTVPSTFNKNTIEDSLVISFRSGSVYKNSYIVVRDTKGNEIYRKKALVIAPGEMEKVKIPKGKLEAVLDEIQVGIEGE